LARARLQVVLSVPVKGSFILILPHYPNTAKVITSLRASDAIGHGLDSSGFGSDWQKSSTITYSVVMKVSRSISSELVFSRIGLISSLDGPDLFFFKSFLFHTKRLSWSEKTRLPSWKTRTFGSLEPGVY